MGGSQPSRKHPVTPDATKPWRRGRCASTRCCRLIPASRKAAEAISKYIITDMYAKAVQGMSAEDAMKWAQAELVKVYGS